ncbi:cytochrome P450 78A7-like [Olea europaea var. sylvestris]|uniref:cytochrome P450 78A7-like n=1 Tax=Olea europaea var. sylvestris TaxID=158386 RepID=UPI000C1D8A69|nr:cytochrome P450 78A7-like [Olea europaea var. sylvestris]
MDLGMVSKDSSWWVFTLPAFLGSKIILDEYILLAISLASVFLAVFTWVISPGGSAWKNGRNRHGAVQIPGPRGLPVFGSLFNLSRGLAHRSLAAMAGACKAKQLMAFSLGATPVVVASDPLIAKEILNSPHFADRPIKQSAKSLMFSRAIGFAPNGTYWRLLRRIAASHLFAPRRIAAHEAGRQMDCSTMLRNIECEQTLHGRVSLRKHLQAAALNNIMGSVFGKRYDQVGDSEELKELKGMIREGFELLGAFNFSDYLPWISYFYDPFRIVSRCEELVPRVRKLVKGIIEEHKLKNESENITDTDDFVDVLLNLEGEEKLNEDDMIAVLWYYYFICNDNEYYGFGYVAGDFMYLLYHISFRQQDLSSLRSWDQLPISMIHQIAFLNGELEEEIHMQQPIGFIKTDKENKVCKLKRSIYDLKQFSRWWYLRFYKSDYLEYIKTIIKWLSSNFEMKDISEANYIFGVKIYRDSSKRLLALSYEYTKKF